MSGEMTRKMSGGEGSREEHCCHIRESCEHPGRRGKDNGEQGENGANLCPRRRGGGVSGKWEEGGG